MSFLAEHYRGTAPFSQLQFLWLFAINESSRFDTLFSHALESLRIEAKSTDSGLSFFASLSYLPRTSPNLQSLTLGTGHTLTMNHLEHLVAQLLNLRRLDLCSRADAEDTLSTSFILALAALKQLSHFTTSCTPCQMLGDTRLPHRTPSFPALHSLRLTHKSPTARQISLWSNFIAFHDLASLRKFSLDSLHPPEPISTTPDIHLALEGLLRTISNVVPPTASLTFSLDAVYTTFEILRPLLTFTNLKELDVRLTALDDNACSQMANSWPNLTTLCVYADPADSATQLPLATLGHFARLCPKLESIDLPIGTTTMPTLTLGKRPSRGYSNPRLTSLGVGDCQLSDSDKYRVAIFLLDHFPGLNWVHACGSLDIEIRDNAKRWKDVSDMLPALSLARSWWEAPPPTTDGAPISTLR